jgi:hypothetical protein
MELEGPLPHLPEIPLDSILSRFNLIHTLIYYFFTISDMHCKINKKQNITTYVPDSCEETVISIIISNLHTII